MVNSAASSHLHAEAPALSMLSRLATPEIAIVEHWAPEYLRSNDPEIGHRLRVAIRRLRALLWAYRDLLPKALADDWRCRLADVAAQIGPPRNWDIMIISGSVKGECRGRGMKKGPATCPGPWGEWS